MAWYEGLILRNTKEINGVGILCEKLFGNYRKAGVLPKLSSKELGEKIGLTDARLKAFFAGLFEDIDKSYVAKFLEAIQMPEAEYKAFSKKTAIPGVGVFSKSVAVPAAVPVATTNTLPAEMLPVPTPVHAAAAVPVPAAPKQQPVKTAPAKTAPASESKAATALKGMTVDNFVEEALIIVVNEKENRIEIHPNYVTKSLATHGRVILAPNSIIFGGKIVPGKVVL